MVDSLVITDWFQDNIADKLKVFNGAKEKLYRTYNDAFERQDKIKADTWFLILSWETGNPVDPGDQQIDVQTSGLYIVKSVSGDDPKDVLAAQNEAKAIFYKQVLPRMKKYMEEGVNRKTFQYEPRITYQPEEKMIGKCCGYAFDIIWKASARYSVDLDDEN